MYQIYFLTVVTNLLAGTVLASGFLKEKIKDFEKVAALLENNIFQLSLGIAALLAGILSLFKFNSSELVIIGDLLPCLTALVSGGLLVLRSVDTKKDDEEEQAEPGILSQIRALGDQYGTAIGFVALIAGILHLISPESVII